MTRRRRFAGAGTAALAVVLAGALLPACSSGSKHGRTDRTAPAVTTTTSPFGTTPAGWLLTTDDPSLGGAPTFVGNGYLATRVPAHGSGYRTTPIETQSQVAGFYAQTPGTSEHRVSVPTWSTFGFSDGSGNFGALPGPGGGTWSDYHQILDLRTGLITTAVLWTSPAGRRTVINVELMTDRARPHVAAVRMTVTPAWSGTATVTDMLDGTGARDSTPTVHSDPSTATMQDTLVATGTRITASVVTKVQASARAVRAATAPGSIAENFTFPVVTGKPYTFTKFVGIATSVDTDRSLRTTADVAARAEATQAASAGYAALLRENAAAWSALWQSNITVVGNPTLTLQARAALFYLLASTRAGVNWSVSPAGLSSDGYNGHVFWDAETWMYPPLLALHPDIAVGINTYRQARLARATQYATASKLRGARFPWESALSGTEQAPAPWGPFEQHITADIVLAQWQYYEATGDRTWLTTKAWPLIRAAADFWASRVTPDPRGGYAIAHVMGPDEFHTDVTNSAYTNSSAAQALRIATRVAALVGAKPDPKWATIAAGLRLTVDPTTTTHPEFDGYIGDAIKQADVVMMQYPWNVSMPKTTAQNDLDYYARLVDPNGPSMSDAIHMIDSASLNTAGCSTDTFLRRSIEPYERGPFDQISETRQGGAFTFLTGAGGFLQEFLYGFTGLSFTESAVQLDPMLPPQLQGVRLTGIAWQGRRFDVSIAPFATTIALTAGAPLPVQVAGGATQTVKVGAPLAVSTRRPDLTPGQDLARCRPVVASTELPGFPALAAVDGVTSTAWHATAPNATFTVDLGSVFKLREIIVHSEHKTNGYTLSLSVDGKAWLPIATLKTRNSANVTTHTNVSARYVRYSVTPGAIASLRELVVRK